MHATYGMHATSHHEREQAGFCDLRVFCSRSIRLPVLQGSLFPGLPRCLFLGNRHRVTCCVRSTAVCVCSPIYVFWRLAFCRCASPFRGTCSTRLPAGGGNPNPNPPLAVNLANLSSDRGGFVVISFQKSKCCGSFIISCSDSAKTKELPLHPCSLDRFFVVPSDGVGGVL